MADTIRLALNDRITIGRRSYTIVRILTAKDMAAHGLDLYGYIALYAARGKDAVITFYEDGDGEFWYGTRDRADISVNKDARPE